MPTIEIHSTSEVDDITVRQNEFAENRRIVLDAEQMIGNSELSQTEKDAAKARLFRHALKNIHAANQDPRVVDKTINLPRI